MHTATPTALLHEAEEQHHIIEESPPALAYRARVAQVKDRETLIAMPKTLRRITNWLGNAYLPLHLAWLVALPWICWRAGNRRRFGVFCAILAVGYAFNLGNNLGIAILHTLQISRYTYVQFATTLLTELLTGFLLMELLATVILRFRGDDTSARPERR